MKTSLFKDRLIEARIARAMSQTDLAHGAGIAPGQISRYEQGKNVPRPHILAKLAGVLGVTAEWLMHGDSTSDEKTQIRFEQSKSGEATLVLRPSPELGERMFRMAAVAGITPDELLGKIIEEWAQHQKQTHEGFPNSPDLTELRDRVDRLEKEFRSAIGDNAKKPKE